MTPEEAIKMLRGMQNKKVDYAEMVCAPAFAYGYQYVYPEPEDYAIEEAITALKELQQYHEIGTVEECRKAAEKQKPKKPDYEGDGYADRQIVYNTWICPNCGKRYEVDYDDYDYCPNCGQAIYTENLEGMEDERD